MNLQRSSIFFAIPGFSDLGMVKSIPVHLEWIGSMILDLKLQVSMNLQLLANSSIAPLSAG